MRVLLSKLLWNAGSYHHGEVNLSTVWMCDQRFISFSTVESSSVQAIQIIRDLPESFQKFFIFCLRWIKFVPLLLSTLVNSILTKNLFLSAFTLFIDLSFHSNICLIIFYLPGYSVPERKGHVETVYL